VWNLHAPLHGAPGSRGLAAPASPTDHRKLQISVVCAGAALIVIQCYLKRSPSRAFSTQLVRACHFLISAGCYMFDFGTPLARRATETPQIRRRRRRRLECFLLLPLSCLLLFRLRRCRLCVAALVVVLFYVIVVACCVFRSALAQSQEPSVHGSTNHDRRSSSRDHY